MKNTKIIYLADDDEDDRMLLKEAIAVVDRTIIVIEAVDGDDLLSKIDLEPHTLLACLVILDMNMPRVNGIEALRSLRSQNSTKNIPAVMLSTSSSQQLIVEAYQSGVNAFMKKPHHFDGYIQMLQGLRTAFLGNVPIA